MKSGSCRAKRERWRSSTPRTLQIRIALIESNGGERKRCGQLFERARNKLRIPQCFSSWSVSVSLWLSLSGNTHAHVRIYTYVRARAGEPLVGRRTAQVHRSFLRSDGGSGSSAAAIVAVVLHSHVEHTHPRVRRVSAAAASERRRSKPRLPIRAKSVGHVRGRRTNGGAATRFGG
jgi:hypothetical protein